MKKIFKNNYSKHEIRRKLKETEKEYLNGTIKITENEGNHAMSSEKTRRKQMNESTGLSKQAHDLADCQVP